MNQTKRSEIFRRLRAENPHPATELDYRTPFELLVAVVTLAMAWEWRRICGGGAFGAPGLALVLTVAAAIVLTGIGRVEVALGVVAIGVALGRPDRRVALFVGDGGMMMTLADLDTAVRYRIPPVVVVSNDSAFGAELHYMREQGYDEAETR